MNILEELAKKLVGHTDLSLSRLVMDKTTLEWVKELPTAEMSAAEISGESWGRAVSWKRYEIAN